MASLLITAAINIGVGLLLNFLFPPKGQNIVQEGPRLNDLTVSSSAYGETINIGYGTVRMGGNIIWSTGLEEEATTNTQSAGGGKGGGGGGSSTSTTYSYFASFAIAFAEGLADDVLRIWGDGKLIYDRTGAGLATDKGLKFRFYKGDETQVADPLIEADQGVGNVPGHRGLVYFVAEKWALADFGNRIPQITAEIAFLSTATAPFTGLIELTGSDLPGSFGGGDSESHMFLDPSSDVLFMFKAANTGISRSSTGSMSMVSQSTDASGLHGRSINVGMNGFIYGQSGGANFEPWDKRDPVSMQVIGVSNATASNGSFVGVLKFGSAASGFEAFLPVVSQGGVLDQGGFVVYEETSDVNWNILLNNGVSADIGRGGPVIQDFFNQRLFLTQESNAITNLWEVTASLNIGLLGSLSVEADASIIATYTKGGVDLTGTADIEGYVILPEEEAMILSNGLSTIKVDMATGAILAQDLTRGFFSTNQWSTNGKFAYGDGGTGIGTTTVITIIDTDDLSVLATQDIDLSAFGDGLDSNYFRQAYDTRSNSLIFSRVEGTSPASNRVVRVQLERGTGLGRGLDLIVTDLCNRAGIPAGDCDVTALASESVLGFTVNNQGPIRAALEPLQRGFLFEGVESDWKLKFVKRGGTSVLTVPEDDLGRLSTDMKDEFLKEMRVQEVELPKVFGVRYSDRDKDYQQGHAQDQRISLPRATQQSRNLIELDLPIVFQATTAKQLAQRWLYTSWAERITIESTMPWKYMRLDPTDVFDITFRGETRQLRLANSENGADLSLDFAATQEDARSDDSVVTGQGGDGHLNQVIPSGLPSRLHLMDLPLLFAADASFQVSSTAYWAAAGYDSTWPGAQLFRSIDDGLTFVESGSAPLEVTWGFVKGTLADPGSTVTWDETSTVDITVARGIARFVTATDIDVLNGANALAVLKANGTPEIIQFTTVTQIDVGTVRLSRLLRGRRGTEDLSTGHTISEPVVLLETSRVFKFQLPLSLINVFTQYKGVTLNTLIEDATPIDFTYTGQDLEPYSVARVAATVSVNTATITWDRRTRFNGDLVDGGDVVPLNEEIESYDIDIKREPGGTVLRTLTSSVESVAYDTTLDFSEAAILVPFDLDDDDVTSNAALGTLGSEATVQQLQSRFGGGSVELSPTSFAGASNSFVSWPDIAAYVLGSSDFTIEAHVRFKDLTESFQVIASHFDNNGADQIAWRLARSGNALDVFFSDDGTATSPAFTFSGAFTFVVDTWYHVACTRRGDTFRLFVDGAQVATFTSTIAIHDSTAVLHVGKFLAVIERPMVGFVDDFRIEVGAARYTLPFTPPARAFATGPVPQDLIVEIAQRSNIAVVGRGRSTEQTIDLG